MYQHNISSSFDTSFTEPIFPLSQCDLYISPKANNLTHYDPRHYLQNKISLKNPRRKPYGTSRSKVAGRLKNIITANQYFAEIESLEELFPRMLELAKSVTEAEAASLLLYNPEGDILEFVAVADEILSQESIEALKNSIKVKIGEGISGWVAETREPIIIADAQSDSRFLRVTDRVTGFTTRNILSVPLIHNDDLLGVLNVLNAKSRPGFELEDQEILASYAYLASAAITRARLIESRLKQQRLEIQLATAGKIQSLFWPETPELGHGSHVWAVSLPAAFVGGDLYDFLPLGDGSWIIYVADVSDKNLPAALIMVALWSQIRFEVPRHNDVELLLEAINESMYDLLAEEGFFATIILGRYWPENGKLHIVRGGHIPPLRISNGTYEDIPELTGVSLGIAKQVHFTKKEIFLAPGESVLFLTDGVTEAENEQHERLGERRLIKEIRKISSPPRSKGLLKTIKSWQGKSLQNDDLTVLEIWRDGD